MAQRLNRCLPLVAGEPAAAAIAAAAAGGAPAAAAAAVIAGGAAAVSAAGAAVTTTPLLSAAAAARWAGSATLQHHRAYASAAAASAAAAAASSKPVAKKKAAAAAASADAGAATLVDGRGKRPRGVGGKSGSASSSSSPRATASRSRSPAAGSGSRRKQASPAAGSGAAAEGTATAAPSSTSSSRLYTRENYAKLAASGWDPAAVASLARGGGEADGGAAFGSSSGGTSSNQQRVFALMARIRTAATLADLQTAVSAGEATGALDPLAVAAAVTRVPKLFTATAQGEQARREKEFALALRPPSAASDESGGGRRRPGKRPDALLEQQARELRASGALPPDATADDVAAARAAAAAAARRTAALAAERLLERLSPALERALPQLGAREVCNCLHAIARANFTPKPRLLDAAVAALLRPLEGGSGGSGKAAIDATSPPELAMLSHAARRLAPNNDALWQAIERRGAEMAREAVAAAAVVSSSAAAAAEAGAAVAEGQQQKKQQQQQQLMGWYEASSIAWAASQAGRRAPELTQALAAWVAAAGATGAAASASSAASSPSLPPRVRDVTALLWAFAEQGPQALLLDGGAGGESSAASAVGGAEAASPCSSGSPSAGEAALTALCDRVAARLAEVEAPGDLSSVLWAVGRLNHLHLPLLRRVAEHLLRTPLAEEEEDAAAPLASSGGVSWRPLPGAASVASAASAATGPVPTARLLAMASWAAARLLPGSLAEVAPPVDEVAAGSAAEGEQQQQEAAAEGAASAAAEGGDGASSPAAPQTPPPAPSPHAPLAAALLLPAANALLRSPALFSPQDAAGVAWAAARLGHRSPSWWREAAERALAPRLAEFGPAQLTNVARAYARQCTAWGNAPPDGLMEGIARAAEKRAGEFGVLDAAGLLRALVAASAAAGGGGGGGEELRAAAEALVSALAQRSEVTPRERKHLAGAAAAAGVADAEGRLAV